MGGPGGGGGGHGGRGGCLRRRERRTSDVMSTTAAMTTRTKSTIASSGAMPDAGETSASNLTMQLTLARCAERAVDSIAPNRRARRSELPAHFSTGTDSRVLHGHRPRPGAPTCTTSLRSFPTAPRSHSSPPLGLIVAGTTRTARTAGALMLSSSCSHRVPSFLQQKVRTKPGKVFCEHRGGAFSKNARRSHPVNRRRTRIWPMGRR